MGQTDPPTPIPLDGVKLDGWRRDAPDTGRDTAFLMLSVASPDAEKMRAVAAGLDLGHQAAQPRLSAVLRIALEGPEGQDKAYLEIAGIWPGDPERDRFWRPVDREWAHAAEQEGRVIVLVVYQPNPRQPTTPDELDAILWANLTAGTYAFGIAEVTIRVATY